LKLSNPVRSTSLAVSTIALTLHVLPKRVSAVASQCSAYLQISAADSQSQKQREMKLKLRLTTASRNPLHKITQEASLSKSVSVKEANTRESCQAISAEYPWAKTERFAAW
jgi:hypothetical protein